MAATAGTLSWANNGVHFNPSFTGPQITLSADYLTATATSGNSSCLGTVGKSTGQYYWEIKVLSGDGFGYDIGIGNLSTNLNLQCGNDVNSFGYVNFTTLNGFKNINGTLSPYGNTPTGGYGAGDTIGVALDMTAGTVQMYKNNIAQGVMVSGLTGTMYPVVSTYASHSCSYKGNFAPGSWLYTPPAGYIHL